MVMECVNQFSVISILIYINTFSTFQFGKFFTLLDVSFCIFRTGIALFCVNEDNLHNIISHGSAR